MGDGQAGAGVDTAGPRTDVDPQGGWKTAGDPTSDGEEPSPSHMMS